MLPVTRVNQSEQGSRGRFFSGGKMEERNSLTKEMRISGEIMQVVLFQTSQPMETPGPVEYYDLSLFQKETGGETLTFVRQIHGWWDNRSQSATYNEEDITQTHAILHYGDALNLYYQMRAYHIRQSYYHSFRWHPVSGRPSFYQRLDIF